MSDPGSPPPGWWLASDGQYYPPETHPDYGAQTAPTAQATEQPTAQATAPDLASLALSGPGVSASRGRRSLPWIIGGVVLAAVVVVGVVAILGTNGVASLPEGSGSATITWSLGGDSSHPKSFSGTADGIAITGTSTGANPSDIFGGSSTSGSGLQLPSSIHMAHWTGTFGGKSFDLNVSMSTGSSSSGSSGFGSFAFHVNGTYDSQPVSIVAHPFNQFLRYSGTVGNLTVSGTVAAPNENGHTGKVTSQFDVTK